MSTYPSAPVIKILPGANPVARVQIQRNKPIYSRAGAVNLQGDGQTDLVVIAFPTPLPDSNYIVQLSVQNWVTSPDLVQFIQARLSTAPAQGGFSVLLSAPPLDGNYWLHWAIAEVYNP